MSLSTGGWHEDTTSKGLAKALRIYVRTYSLCNRGRLSANIKLTLYKTFIRSVMTDACPTS
jgi:hypothetical protein